MAAPVTPPPALPPGPLSVRAYARHRGVSAPSVLRAIRSGRLKLSLVSGEDGKAKIADARLADAEWEAHTDLTKAPVTVKERARNTAARPVVADSPLVAASARERVAKAKLAELEYEKKAGELISRDELNAKAAQLETSLSDYITRCRARLLSIPSRARALKPEMGASELRFWDQLIRDTLEELGTP